MKDESDSVYPINEVAASMVVPLPLSSEQYDLVLDGAAPLLRADQDGYLELVAQQLRDCPAVTNRAVVDAVTRAQRSFFSPPDMRNEIGHHANRRIGSKLANGPPIEFDGRRRR